MTVLPEHTSAPRNASETWLEANRVVLQSALARLRNQLERHADRGRGMHRPGTDAPSAEPGEVSALALVRDIFGLTTFETDLLVLVAGVELDGAFPALCAAAAGDRTRAEPTFGLALGCLAGAHWSALAADAPLRRWSLVTLGGVPGPASSLVAPLTRLPLRVDERILHFLVGLDTADTRLAGVVVEEPDRGEALPPGQERVANQIRSAWVAGQRVVHVAGRSGAVLDVAARAATGLDTPGRLMWSSDVPSEPSARAELGMLLTRDALLGGGPLLVRQVEDSPTPERWLGSVGGRVALLGGSRPELSEPVVTVDVPVLTREEQSRLWLRVSAARVAADAARAPGDATRSAPDGTGAPRTEARGATEATQEDDPARLTAQFHLDARHIEAAGREALAAGVSLWTAARHQTRGGLDGLAQRIESPSTWDDLVLTPDATAMLRDVAAQVRHRHTVHVAWGMSPPGGVRGGGVSAMFAGASGTGKTLSSEVLASDLGLDLWRVDLSQVVSKYIGETEKNLSRVFDAADHGGCVLLLDEADALFGKRSESKDAHDRYANIEVAHLLQRMESFRGLAILTTNLRDNIDPAFLRRLQFVLSFPFPDAPERERIWARMFPDAVPTQGLRLPLLARLVVSGGVIRNIAVSATYLAAAESGPVTMQRLLRAAHRECTKLERPLAESEVGDWG